MSPYLVAGTCYHCDAPSVGRWINAELCGAHSPEVPEPDPTRNLAALRKAAGQEGRVAQLSPFAVKGGSDITKERPGGYVSRQRAARIAAGTTERQRR